MNTEENKSILIADAVKEFVRESSYNIFPETVGHYFDEPLVQFAASENPLFLSYKDLIGEYHLTPQEVLQAQFPERADLHGSVICIVLPVNSGARESNRMEKEFGSREWALTRYYGDELFTDQLTEYIVAYLRSMGYWGTAPAKSDFFYKKKIGQDISSNWSERHIAYAAGLGTFSINDGFITEKGIAVKLLSIVTDAELGQSRQEYPRYRQNCLRAEKGICGACMQRCPVGAITADGHDKIKCFLHCYGETSKKTAGKYGASTEYGSGCGLCQTGVPCEYQNPMQR